MKTIIHAGFHKTGTTTLQQGFTAHRAWLDAQGISYPPDRGGMPAQHGLACTVSSAHERAGPNDLFLPEREAFSANSGAWAACVADVLPEPAAHALRLISSEIIATFDEAELLDLAAAIGPIDRFILYVRNGIGFLYSCWVAKVSWGYKGAFDGFLRAAINFDPATAIIGPLRFVDLLTDLFGPDRVVVRSFDAALTHPRGISGDFLEQELGLPGHHGCPTDVVANASPPKVITEAKRALNILAGPSPAGIAPSSHGVLRQAIAGPQGAELVKVFSRVLQPLAQKIAIDDLCQGAFAADGAFRTFSDKAQRMADWRFPPLETVTWIETNSLVEALQGCPEFVILTKMGSL